MLDVADEFLYLDSTLSTVTINEKVTFRMAHASAAFGRLQASMWERRVIRLQIKLKVYHVVIMISLLQLPCKAVQILSHEVPQETLPHEMAGQHSRHTCPLKSKHA